LAQALAQANFHQAVTRSIRIFASVPPTDKMDILSCAYSSLPLGSKCLALTCAGLCAPSQAKKAGAPQASSQKNIDADVPRLAPASATQEGDRCAGVLAFLCGTGTDHCGRTLAELRTMDFDDMERLHNFIQWMFPTDEASRFNSEAPLLTLELQQQFADSPVLQEEVKQNLFCFCNFLGLALQYGEDGSATIVEAAHFFDRWDVCWRGRFGMNHNWMRISRVLACLGLCGLLKEQEALFRCMEVLYAEGVPCGSAIAVWRERALTRAGCGEASL